MVFLKFQIGAEAYLLDAAQIVEVLPLVDLKRMPQVPAGVVGLFNYRGTPVPVVDLSELTLGQPAEKLMSTRLILVRYGAGSDASVAADVALLGLIAEKVTETLQRTAADFADAGITSDGAPYLGAVTRDQDRLLQRVDLHKLLPESVRGVLFRQAREHSWS